MIVALDNMEETTRVVEMARRNFPDLHILARARNRFHAHLLMDRGVDGLVRETFYSSLRLGEMALTALGIAPAEAARAVELFREHDERNLSETQAIYRDDQKLLQSVQEAARELEGCSRRTGRTTRRPPRPSRVALSNGTAVRGFHPRTLWEERPCRATERNETAPRAVVENIEAILSLENAALRSRTPADKASDGIASFVGSLTFVLVHVVWFVAWAVVNAGLISFIPAFDPYPFQLLCMIVSLEGVLLSTFVLIKQNRMSYLSDRRNHLDLQINMLSEREVTRLLVVTDRIARHIGVATEPADEQAAELSQDTAIDKLMGAIDEKLSEED